MFREGLKGVAKVCGRATLCHVLQLLILLVYPKLGATSDGRKVARLYSRSPAKSGVVVVSCVLFSHFCSLHRKSSLAR